MPPFMKRQRTILRSQLLAAAVTSATVLIMLTPLRRGPDAMTSRLAGWMPLLNLGGMADTSAFHRLEVSASRHHASEVPLIRRPAVSP
jgi:hypothetical protein